MNPFTLRREMQKDIFNNIVPYLRRNYDSKIHRAIIKSHCLPMIFNPIHYFSKTTNNDWFIYYYAINKNFLKTLHVLPHPRYKQKKALMFTNISLQVSIISIYFHLIFLPISFKIRKGH